MCMFGKVQGFLIGIERKCGEALGFWIREVQRKAIFNLLLALLFLVGLSDLSHLCIPPSPISHPFSFPFFSFLFFSYKFYCRHR